VDLDGSLSRAESARVARGESGGVGKAGGVSNLPRTGVDNSGPEETGDGGSDEREVVPE
jgi:hypothetical protein